MYILNNQEEAMLKIIVKNARVDYFRKNKHVFQEMNLEEDILYTNDKMEEEVENKLEEEIQANQLENIFVDKNLSKIAKALTYNEKLVLSLYYVEEKTDEEISKILFMTRSAVNKKRIRAIKKIKKECEKRGILNV